MQELLNEAKRLASEGVKELVLVAQETTLYGKDLTGEKQLPLLFMNFARSKGLNGSACYTAIQKRSQMS